MYDEKVIVPIKLSILKDVSLRPSATELSKMFQDSSIQIVRRRSSRSMIFPDEFIKGTSTEMSFKRGESKTVEKKEQTRGKIRLKTAKIYKIDRLLVDILEKPFSKNGENKALTPRSTKRHMTE